MRVDRFMEQHTFCDWGVVSALIVLVTVIDNTTRSPGLSNGLCLPDQCLSRFLRFMDLNVKKTFRLI